MVVENRVSRPRENWTSREVPRGSETWAASQLFGCHPNSVAGTLGGRVTLQSRLRNGPDAGRVPLCQSPSRSRNGGPGPTTRVMRP